jgi:hypothetical protein
VLNYTHHRIRANQKLQLSIFTQDERHEAVKDAQGKTKTHLRMLKTELKFEMLNTVQCFTEDRK